jgi:3-polyprenyl-4-hydroxybenzoate decarboxylase
MGVVIAPPVPAFYSRPRSIDEMVNYSAARLLDQLGLHVDVDRWPGLNSEAIETQEI